MAADANGVIDLLPARIESRARENPDEIAIVCNERRFSRAHVEKLANAFAASMSRTGAGYQSRVIVALPPGIEFVVACYGAMKLGAAFAPIDPDISTERLDHVIHAMEATVIVCSRDFEREHPLPIVALTLDPVDLSSDDDSGSARTGDAAPEAVRANNDDIAYILFTSGTTGMPKGVEVSHGAMANLLDWENDTLDLTADDAVLQRSPTTFDISLWEIWLPLAYAGRSAIPDAAMRNHPALVREFMQANGVTIAQLVPQFLNAFLQACETDEGAGLDRLRCVVSNGEHLPDPTRRRFHRVFPRADLFNQYGPTECTVAVTSGKTPTSDIPMEMSIGYPAKNCRIHILDQELKAVAPGEKGEMCISGVQLARGYVGASDEERARFLFAETVGERVYRTGDIGRVADDGSIEIFGRNDRQLKIKGYRVEPAEIEHFLERHNGVEAAAVFEQNRTLPNGEEKPILVGYVTPLAADVGALHQWLGQLPDYMRPQILRTLDSFPTTKNGKIDYSRLQPPDLRDFRDAARGSSETTDEQTAVVGILQTSFGVLVNADNRIDQLGLDSLDIFRLSSELEQAGYRVGFDESDLVLRSGTIRELARKISRTKPNIGNAPAPLQCNLADAFSWADRFRGESSVMVVHASLTDVARSLSKDEIRSQLLTTIAKFASKGITLVFPTFTYTSFCESRCFDIESSRSESGLLGDWVRQEFADSIRTPNPIYSWTAVGPRARELLSLRGELPFGEDSPAEWFEKNNALIVALGTTAMTQTHRAEYVAGVPYHVYVDIEGMADFGQGRRPTVAKVFIRDLDYYGEGALLRQNIEKTLSLLGNALRVKSLGGELRIHCIDSVTLRNRLTAGIAIDPFVMLLHPQAVRERLHASQGKMHGTF